MDKQEIQDRVNRDERRQMDRRMAERVDGGRRLVDQRKSVQRIMEQIKADALHVCAAGEHFVALSDFKPKPIVDGGGYRADSWGDLHHD